jgi:hypothetical protein
MNSVSRREFLGVLGSAAALSSAIPNAFASAPAAGIEGSSVTALYVKGLVMVDLSDPQVIRLGFPKAPGHKATLSVLAQNGTKQLITVKGRGAVEAQPVSPAIAKLEVPELIRMKEFYGDSVKSHVDACPGLISIPRNTIRSIKTTEVTKSRYTFVRADTGEEVNSFRPRQLADAIRIDLSSAGTLKLDDGKSNIPLASVQELRVEYTTDRSESPDPLTDHFHHYFPYIERPAALNYDVVPRKLGAASSPTPHAGHHFMRLDFVVVCSLVAVP